jgi:hypothetical protein
LSHIFVDKCQHLLHILTFTSYIVFPHFLPHRHFPIICISFIRLLYLMPCDKKVFIMYFFYLIRYSRVNTSLERDEIYQWNKIQSKYYITQYWENGDHRKTNAVRPDASKCQNFLCFMLSINYPETKYTIKTEYKSFIAIFLWSCYRRFPYLVLFPVFDFIYH